TIRGYAVEAEKNGKRNKGIKDRAKEDLPRVVLQYPPNTCQRANRRDHAFICINDCPDEREGHCNQKNANDAALGPISSIVEKRRNNHPERCHITGDQVPRVNGWVSPRHRRRPTKNHVRRHRPGRRRHPKPAVSANPEEDHLGDRSMFSSQQWCSENLNTTY